MVYLLDPNTGTAMSQDHQYLAQAISERYSQFRLAQVPLSNRSKREEFPFAILHADTKEVVKELRESDMNINTIFTWLYENDTAIHGADTLFRRYKAEQEKAKAAKAYAVNERMQERLEVVHSMANSPLMKYKHDGRVYG